MHDDDHGHSAAAWIGIAVMFVATALACFAAVFGPAWLFWAGVVLFPVGSLVWYLLSRTSLGLEARKERERAALEAREGRERSGATA
ncbi:HGxxPAAW family protein [Ornithinimicrobium sp. Y1847]|uniref:HGxxPAAW family protein n=1 Tax=unclassified Ornithinimicrobium TaxID=2615080 RepID=UPI003B6711D6